ncbi:DUF2155 domain-containing protein [Afipia carboxidovorans]|uniref:DUF2155 domain-containing protein n=1 Tax=Afipia carboxidovorans TaxID=40137 RepID=UPI00308736D0|nr:DUF2155 domain-containing protein [Afipia carboxidovorans]
MLRTAATISFATLIAASLFALPPARAQIGNIFSDQPLRPPAGLSHGDPTQDPDEEEVPEIPQGRLLPAPQAARPLPPGQGAPRPGAVQSQPLAPPPGSATVPQQQPPNVAVNPPPGNALPGQKPPAGNPQQSPATLQPGDEIVTEPPAIKIPNKKAVFSGLDKITGRIITFDQDIGETVQFGALRVKTDACYTRPATEAANTDAFVEVDEITLQNEVKRIFSGWMFAASPGLHAVEHPIYDVWLIDCKSPEQPVTAQNEPVKPAPPPQQTQQRRQARPQPAQQPRQPAPPPPFGGYR